jgi:hypothetical protein
MILLYCGTLERMARESSLVFTSLGRLWTFLKKTQQLGFTTAKEVQKTYTPTP